MALVRVVVLGTIGKSVLLDTSLPARVAALETSTAAAAARGVTSHHALTGLQEGDDHPQYAMNAAAETITAAWNFTVEPAIFGFPLSEFIEDTIGNELENSDSIFLTYSDYGATTGKISAHLNREYVEDLVGGMLVDTPSIDLTYTDTAGRIYAFVKDEYIEDLMARTLCDSPTIEFDHYDTSGCIRAHLTATLADLLDVDMPSLPSYGDVLTFNGFAWVPLPGGSGGGGIVDSIVAGSGITVDSTDPANPIVSATGGGGGAPDGSRIIAGYATLAGNVGGGWNGYTVAMKVLGGGILTKATDWKLTIGHTTANMTIAAAKLRKVARDSTTYIDSTAITWGGSATPTLAAGRNTSDVISVTTDPQFDYYILIFIDAATSAGMAPSGPGSHPFYNTLLTFGYLLGDHTADATFTGYTSTGQNIFQPELIVYNP